MGGWEKTDRMSPERTKYKNSGQRPGVNERTTYQYS